MQIMIHRLLFCLFLFPCAVCAQPKPSDQELANFGNLAFEKIKLFQKYISKFAAKGKSPEQAQMKPIILKLFEPGARIEVSNKKGGKKKYQIAAYLDMVASYNKKYQIVVIDFYATKVSTLRPFKKDNQIYYAGTASFAQRFCGKVSSELSPKWDYCDITIKNVEIILEYEYNSTETNGWILLLGDITVQETRD